MDQIESIRKRQLAFALSVGVPYFAFVISIFLVVYLASDAVTQISLMGFPLHYWLVAIAIYPITWGLFIWYVGKANSMEDEITQKVESLEDDILKPMTTMGEELTETAGGN